MKIVNCLQSNNVTNLSDYNLSADELKVLNKGLTFVPHNIPLTYKDLNDDVKRLERKLQISFFFHRKNQHDTAIKENSKAYKKQPLTSTNLNWWPKKLNGRITEFCDNLKHELFNIRKLKDRSFNLTIQEMQALRNLSSNSRIIIKKADKNSGIVILNTKDYHDKVMNMLNDVNVYTKVNDYNIYQVKSQSDDLALELLNQENISNKQFKYITEYEPKFPIFYGMPKIHKEGCPLRPIVSQIDGPTYRINQLIHELLYVAESEIPFLFKDTTAFLNVIEEHKNECTSQTILVTMDVVSLYTNIPHDEAVQHVCLFYEETLDKWKNYYCSITPVNVEILEKLLKFMLSECTFEFDDTLFKQNYGCPMGAPASVRIANIYMYVFLRKFLNTYKGNIPKFIGRLIDDIFFLWEDDESKLLDFYNNLNSFHSTIKFELNYSKESVNFLDTTTYIIDNKLHTKLYTKPTDKKQYLHFSSCHPEHVKKAIPYSQALRYRRIIDLDSELKTALNLLEEKFLNRDYDNTLIHTELEKVFDLDREDTLKYKDKTNTENAYTAGMFLPLILTYSFKYSDTDCSIGNIIKKLWNKHILSNKKLNECFGENLPKIVFKKGPSLADKLITAKFKSNKSTDNDDDVIVNILAEMNAESEDAARSVSRCMTARCKCCTVINTDNTITSNVTKTEYRISDHMSCNTVNIIYVINCLKCNKQYVGETGRKLKDRLNNHRSDIRLKKQTAIAIHFNDILHSIRDLSIIPIEIAERSDYRKYREDYWIKQLKCYYPFGLNYYPLVQKDQN